MLLGTSFQHKFAPGRFPHHLSPLSENPTAKKKNHHPWLEVRHDSSHLGTPKDIGGSEGGRAASQQEPGDETFHERERIIRFRQVFRNAALCSMCR